ncbi:hypothetical protein BDK62_10216 [Halomonas alkaliantarctica]|nr:hypothetical protein BDK62_10216 [Halomonas alkaliantarctica]
MQSEKSVSSQGPWSEPLECSRWQRVFGGALLGGFVLFMLAQHALVFPYHDDWGYATLTYTTEVGAGIGRHFTQLDLMRFLYSEYWNWSGRFFPFYLQINLFSWGVEAVRVVQVFVLAVMVVSATAAARKGEPWHPVLLVPVVYLLALPEFVTTSGLYWFSASIAYVWGLALFGLATWRVARNGRLDWLATLLYALAALFHEQMAVAMPAFVLTYGVLQFLAQRSWEGAGLWLCRLCITIGAGALVIFAPGNFVRRAVSHYPHEGVVDTLLSNVQVMNQLILHPEGRLALLAWLAAGIVYGALLFTRHAKTTFVAAGLSVGTLLLALLAWQGLTLFFPALLLLFGVVLMLGVWWHRVPVAIAAAFFAAVASLVLLLLAPVVASRALLTFYCLMLIPLTYAGALVFRFSPLLMVVVLMAFAVPAANKAGAVYEGYAQNAPTHQLNGAKLLAAGMEAEVGRVPDQLVLYRLPNDRFAETMPYQRELVETWMRRYYQVPEGVNIEWQAPLDLRQ